MNSNLDWVSRPAVMFAVITAVLVVAVTLFVNRPSTDEPGQPQSGPAGSIPVRNPHLSSASPTATPGSSTTPGDEPTSSDASTRFDPNQPPADAPGRIEVAEARDLSAKFVETVYTYGYPDTSPNAFIARCAPLMTGGLASTWHQVTKDAGEDGGPTWHRLIDNKQRHITEVDKTTVIDHTHTTHTTVVEYRSGDVPAGRSLPGNEKARYVAVITVRTGDGWRVQDFHTSEGDGTYGRK